jgi:hypothetical protein
MKLLKKKNKPVDQRGNKIAMEKAWIRFFEENKNGKCVVDRKRSS